FRFAFPRRAEGAPRLETRKEWPDGIARFSYDTVLWIRLYRRGRTRNAAADRLIDIDVVGGEGASGYLLQIDARLLILTLRADLAGLGLRQIALRLNHLENRGGAERVHFLLGIERLFFEDTLLDRRVVLRASLPQRDYRILHIHADLVLLLPVVELGFAQR